MDPITRLEALERAVAGLVASPRRRRSEAAQPNYLTVTPAGVVGANFTGQVHAQGLNLDAATISTPPTQDQIRWIRQSDAFVAVAMQGFGFAAESDVAINANAPPGGDNSEVVLATYNQVGSQVSSLTLSHGFGVADFLFARTGTASATIIDGNGQSNFLQLLSKQQLAINFGFVNFPAGTTLINHGLGRVPQAVFLTPAANAYGSAVKFYVDEAFTITSTQFQVRNDSASIDSYWMVVG
jgi:hypothetical protein